MIDRDLPQFIDNQRKDLKSVLKSLIDSKDYEDLSIATGYWDLPGMIGLIDGLKRFKNIRLLIGAEPIPSRIQRSLNLFDDDAMFPDDNFKYDLEHAADDEFEVDTLREVAKVLKQLMENGVVSVKVFRQPRLHAKAYIFGNLESSRAVGIIGSSNFTKAGLETNCELSYAEYDQQKVLFSPKNEQQENGHLSWFNELWNDDKAVEWTGNFLTF